MNVHTVEQNSPEWYALRSGLPTASEFKKIITSQGKASTQLNGYAALLAAELYAGDQLERWEGNQWTERGHELELKAMASYSFINAAPVEKVGFCTREGAGCSPDGLVGDTGLLEIKCLSPQAHVLALAYHNKNNRPQPDYIPQVQGQMYVTEREYCDLYFYHPVLPELCIRVERDDEFHTALEKQLQLVIAERDRLAGILEAA